MQRPRARHVTEKSLVREVCSAIKAPRSPWPHSTISREFPYEGGAADLVLIRDHRTVIALEAKLTRWRTAVTQAYRNTSFAHYSYVVLPEAAANIAAQAPHEFASHSVGLCAYADGALKVIIPAPYSDPILPWLTDVAISYAD